MSFFAKPVPTLGSSQTRGQAFCGICWRSRTSDAQEGKKMRRVPSKRTGPPTRRRRQPKAGERAKLQIARKAHRSEKNLYFNAFHIKEDPGARRARVFRRMGEGLGAGGHATRRRVSNIHTGVSFRSSQKLFSERAPQKPPAPRARPCRPINRQVHMPAVGKFQIARLDAKAPRRPAAAFDHKARADRKSAGETVRFHETSWGDCRREPTGQPMPHLEKPFHSGRRRAAHVVDSCGMQVKRGCSPMPTAAPSPPVWPAYAYGESWRRPEIASFT
jgi:hypothetical protein